MCIFKFVVLVKLAFAMQRLREHKKIGHDQQRWGGEQFLDFVGGTAIMRGDIFTGGPPLGKTLDHSTLLINIFWHFLTVRSAFKI